MGDPNKGKVDNEERQSRMYNTMYSFGHDVGCQEGLPPGTDYAGIANMTVDGRPCLVWAESNKTYSYMGKHNQCRNPNSENGHDGI